MNSNQPDFDWHKPGVWMAVVGGEVQFTTAAGTPYSCRATLVRDANARWSKLEAAGFVIQSFTPEVDHTLRTGQDIVTSDETFYRYPAAGPEHKAPSGGVHLLTIGGITVPGTWQDDAGFIGWHPKVRRNKELEIQLGYRT